MNNCLLCNKETTNPKFCSRNCSATYTNSHKPKRVAAKKFCAVCSAEIPSFPRRKTCVKCRSTKWLDRSIQEARDKYGISHHAKIRAFSRKKLKDNVRVCASCGYSKHVEVCHLIPVRDFPSDATIDQINDLNNLVLLCRNCHWELDHNLLDLGFIEFGNLHP